MIEQKKNKTKTTKMMTSQTCEDTEEEDILGVRDDACGGGVVESRQRWSLLFDVVMECTTLIIPLPPLNNPPLLFNNSLTPPPFPPSTTSHSYLTTPSLPSPPSSTPPSLATLFREFAEHARRALPDWWGVFQQLLH